MAIPDKTAVIYELPLNNRMRNFLRYEYLIGRLEHLIEQESAISAIQTLLELLELTTHSDIKGELLQHLQWQEQRLNFFSTSKETNPQQAKNLIDEKQKLISALDSFYFPAADYQHNNFLKLVKLRLSVPGGVCSFDLPILNAWLNYPQKHIHRDLRNWYEPFTLLRDCIHNSLSMTRMSSGFKLYQALDGSYIRSLSQSQQNYTMIRVRLQKPSLMYPEISASKRHLTVHFFGSDKIELCFKQLHKNIDFELAYCIL